jgi:fibronectin-binding autotransporter adhesin
MKTKILTLLLALCALTVFVATPARAASATWDSQPVNGNWNDFQNWSPQTVPNGASDVATMGSSFNRSVSLSANTEVNGITFPKPSFPTAVNYAITIGPTLTLTISGTGITNNSGQAQNFVTNAASSQGEIVFSNSATAGSGTFTNNGGTVLHVGGGIVDFEGTSSAGNGAFTNNGSTVNGATGGQTNFADSATAASASFINDGGTGTGAGAGTTQFFGESDAGGGNFTNNGGAFGGRTDFFDNSSASNGTFTTNGSSASGVNGGLLDFFGNSSAGSATLIANGGTSGGGSGLITFFDDSLGGFARVEVFGNGSLAIADHNAPGVGIGSLQGNGIVFLGGNNLTVGLNNLSTVFSGAIQDGGAGGSLTKLGRGKLTLSKANTYTGVTTIDGGTLLVKNKTGSATGSNAVQVNNGTLGGTGKINGAVTVGNGSLSGAILLGGNSTKSPGTLTINNTLTFNSLSTYKCVLNRSTPKASTITTLGVTINSNASFTFVDTGTGTLPVSTVFTVINNTSTNPIAGTFSNLANGSTFTSNGNTFKVSYTGGTGNDLTLKVVQ